MQPLLACLQGSCARALRDVLAADARLFVVADKALLAGVTGLFRLTAYSDSDFSAAEITVDRDQAGRNRKPLLAVLAHEMGHALYAIEHPAEIAALQRLLDERDRAMQARPRPENFPELLARSLVLSRPTEEFARATEQIITAEVEQSQWIT